MRRMLPHLAALLTVLLLVQWADAARACLAPLRFDPASVLCHAGDDPAPRGDGPGSRHAGLACAHCAPLPPALAAAPPTLAPPRIAILFAPTTPRPAPPPGPAPRLGAHQPRAPPIPA